MGQQLFFAGMWTGYGPRKPYVKTTVPADMSLLRPVGHRQLVFFDAPRDLAAHPGLLLPPAILPGLEAALMHFVGDNARRHGWPRTKADRTAAPYGSCSRSRTPPGRRSGAATSRC